MEKRKQETKSPRWIGWKKGEGDKGCMSKKDPEGGDKGALFIHRVVGWGTREQTMARG